MDSLDAALAAARDPEYRSLMVRLVPNLDPDTIVGVRTPRLRQLARQIRENPAFFQALPHRYFEENQIHALAISQEKDFRKAVAMVESFLPFVDNWATCDQLRPVAFRGCQGQLLPYIRRWLESTHPYTIRFAVEMLMLHNLDAAFDPEYPRLVAGLDCPDYYVKMMIAWYFATALAKQFDAVLPYLTQRRLEVWTHNKAIQKAVESRRISSERKALLKQYRIS